MNVRAVTAPSLRRLVFAGLAVALLFFVTPASAATKLVSPSVVASTVANKSVTVTVDSYGGGTWGGTAFVGGNQVFLGQAAYRDAERGGGVGLFLLLHETGHTTGIADEHAADCFSLTHVKAVLRTFWKLPSASVNQRFQDALAWPGKYDGNYCLRTAGSTSRL